MIAEKWMDCGKTLTDYIDMDPQHENTRCLKKSRKKKGKMRYLWFVIRKEPIIVISIYYHVISQQQRKFCIDTKGISKKKTCKFGHYLAEITLERFALKFQIKVRNPCSSSPSQQSFSHQYYCNNWPCPNNSPPNISGVDGRNGWLATKILTPNLIKKKPTKWVWG